MRRILISSIIALVITGLLTAGYFVYRRYSGDVAEAIKAVPPDASFIIECRDAQTAIFNLRQTEYWQHASAFHLPASLLHIDSVLNRDPDFSLWKQKPLVISAHVTKADDFDWLFLLETPRGTNAKDVTGFIKKLIAVSAEPIPHEFDDVVIYEITATEGRTFSFALSKGILMCSYTSFLVEDAVRQLKNGSSLKSNKAFYSVYKTAGKNTDANLYFNYKSFSHFLGIYANQEATASLVLDSALAEWSEADARFNSSAILFSGYSSVKDTGQLMATMVHQQPQKNRMATILPARTAWLFHLGFSDSKSFFERLQYSSFGGGEINDNKYKGTGLTSLKKNLTSWVGREMALVITESNTTNYSNNSFACIEAHDTLEAMRSLKEVCSAAEPKGAPCKTESYHGHEIGLIREEGLLKTVYGKMFEGIKKNYFTCVGSYIVFANKVSALRSFIDDADSKNTLSADIGYRQALANSDSSSNVFVYLNFLHSLNIIRSLSTPAMIHALDEKNGLNPARLGLSALVLQYSNKFSTENSSLGGSNLVFNRYVLQFSETVKKKVGFAWSAECDTSLRGTPQYVNDGSNAFFMIQDEANRLYLIDDAGQQVWKKQLDEKMMSNVYSIDFFHNGTKQFLFNTSSFLYLIDKSGAYMGNFPIHLPAPASNGCTVADFDINSNYKIFIACTNQILYAYEMNGKAMNGWLYNKPAGTITHPLKYFKVKDKDYLFVASNEGKMEMLDRQGALRAKSAEKIIISPFSEIAEVDSGDAATAHVVLADTSGNVFAVYTDGHTEKLLPGHLAQPVYFDAADINNNNKTDYVSFGNNTITVQESNGVILFTHEFRNAEPGIFTTVSGGMVGSISPSVNEITIYNRDGNIYPGFPVKGSTGFSVTPLTQDGKKYIAVGSNDGNLYLYVVE